MAETTLNEIVYAVSNLGIFLGYCFIAVVVVPAMEHRLLQTRIGGTLFFITCGLTHAHLAYHAITGGRVDHRSPFSLVNHVVQVIAVWLFITGLYREYVVPHNRRMRQGRGT